MCLASQVIAKSATPVYLSLEGAAALYGWATLRVPDEICLVRPSREASRAVTRVGTDAAPRVTVRRYATELPPEAFTVVSDLPTLTPPYLIGELLVHLPRERALVAAESGIAHFLEADLRQREATERRWEALRGQLHDIIAARESRRGRTRALQRLRFLSPWSDSPGETLLRLRCSDTGLLPGVPQYPRGRYFIDLAWPDEGVAFEFDGAIKYEGARGRAALVDEKAREDALRMDFPRFFRWVWDDLYDTRIDDRIRACFPENSAALFQGSIEHHRIR